MMLLVANNSEAGPAEVSGSLAPIPGRRWRTSECWRLVCKRIIRRQSMIGEPTGNVPTVAKRERHLIA